MTPTPDPAEVFRQLEIALYGKADNTWERGRGERVQAVIRAALAAADAHAQEQARELRVLQHEHSLMEADTQRGVTDCSTPMFIRVRNIKEQLEAAEALVRTLQAERDEARDVCLEWDKLHRQQRERAEAAESTQARLREALDKYGRHTACRMGKCVRCGIGPPWHGNVLGQDHALEPSPCTCGFSAALTPAADQDEKRNA